MTASATLTDEFDRDGYAVVRGVLGEDDFTGVRAEYADLLTECARRWRRDGLFTGGGELAGKPFDEHLVGLAALPGFDPALLSELDITLPHMPFTSLRPSSKVHTGPAVLALLRNEKVLDVVSRLVGGEISASPNQHVRLKLPAPAASARFGARRGETIYAPTFWHQDAMTQIPQSDDTMMVTCWIPLMDVDEEHGCLLVVPRRHKEELLPWPMGPETVAGLEDNAVPLPVAKGDLVLLHKRTPHGSSVNRSGRLRWSFDFRYYPSHEPSDRPWFPSVVARSVAHPERAATDAEHWYRQWDAARAMFVRSGQMVPGRREFSQLVADSLIKRWESGDFPRLDEAVVGADA